MFLKLHENKLSTSLPLIGIMEVLIYLNSCLLWHYSNFRTITVLYKVTQDTKKIINIILVLNALNNVFIW